MIKNWKSILQIVLHFAIIIILTQYNKKEIKDFQFKYDIKLLMLGKMWANNGTLYYSIGYGITSVYYIFFWIIIFILCVWKINITKRCLPCVFAQHSDRFYLQNLKKNF